MTKRYQNIFLDKIDPKVLAVVLFVSVVEFELFTFTKGIVLVSKQDAWISTLLCGLFVAATVWLMVKLASRFPRENYFQYNKKIWGKPIAYILAFSYLIYWAIYLVILFNDFAYTNKFFFLHKTPSLITHLLVALGVILLVPYGLTAIVRFFQLLFPFMIIPIIILVAIAIRNIDLTNFHPILSGGVIPVIKGSFFYAGGLQGLEVILFISPFLKDVKKSAKPALLGVAMIILMGFMLVVLGIGLMGVSNLKYSVFPGIDTLSAVEFPGFAVERYELFLTFPWITGVFTTICIFVYLLSYGIIDLFGFNNKKTVVIITTVVLIALTYIIPNYDIQEKLRMFYNYLTLLFVFAIPVFTLLISIIRSKRDNYE